MQDGRTGRPFPACALLCGLGIPIQRPVAAIQSGPHDEKTRGNGHVNGQDPGAGDESPGRSATCFLPTARRARIPEQEWVDIVRAIAARDETALRALYERSHRIVFTLTMRIAQNRQTAEELTIDVFHDVWRRAPQYDAANGPVLGWILNQARSRAIDRVRHEQRRKRVNRFSARAAHGVRTRAVMTKPSVARRSPASCGRP